MSRAAIGNGLIWLILMAAIPATLAALAPGSESAVENAALGHDGAACRPCRVQPNLKGPSLPYELDGGALVSASPAHAVDGAPGLGE